MMAAKGQGKNQLDWRSDWWLWPSAFLLAVGGWGQAMWIWENLLPEGLAPLWLLLWVGVGVAGLTLPIHWFARRWAPFGWIAIAGWVGVPRVMQMADRFDPSTQAEAEWLYNIAPLLVLSLLGVGLSGVMMSLSWYARRRWSAPVPNIRILREALWAAIFAVFCGLLLISRAFSFPSVLMLAGALILVETFIVVRESTPVHSDGSQG